MSSVVALDGTKLDIDSTNLNDKFHVGTCIINNCDLNDITTAGMYRLQNNITNAPANYEWSQMLVVYAGADTMAQIVFPYTGARIAWRAGFSTSFANWTDWHYLTQSTS